MECPFPLHLAISASDCYLDPEFITFFRENSFRVSEKNWDGNTPLHYLAIFIKKSRQNERLQYLLKGLTSREIIALYEEKSDSGNGETALNKARRVVTQHMRDLNAPRPATGISSGSPAADNPIIADLTKNLKALQTGYYDALKALVSEMLWTVRTDLHHKNFLQLLPKELILELATVIDGNLAKKICRAQLKLEKMPKN